jgi:hypothetical protein
LLVKGFTAKNILKEMLPVYSGKCLSHKVVHRWVKKLSQGCSKVADKAQPSRPAEIATEATVQQAEDGEDMLNRIVTGDESCVYH